MGTRMKATFALRRLILRLQRSFHSMIQISDVSVALDVNDRCDRN